MMWHWRNDPQGLPDDDYARLIAAPGKRLLVGEGQLFRLTNQLSFCPPALAAPPASGDCNVLQLEYGGMGWPRGRTKHTWRSAAFDSGPLGKVAQYSAGLVLLRTLAAELAVG
jgi:hypothetical protein